MQYTCSLFVASAVAFQSGCVRSYAKPQRGAHQEGKEIMLTLYCCVQHAGAEHYVHGQTVG